jgi:hypothetical protein
VEKKPRTLKLDQLELAAVESVEIALQDRADALNATTATTLADPNFAISPNLSGFVECNSQF